jgi:glutathione synthase/RimK-type ligase-like ATP-grasp enzyme
VILVLGSKEFYQVGKVIDCLELKGANVEILDLNSDDTINADFSSGFDGFLYKDGIDISQPRVIWKASKFIYNEFGDTTEWIDNYTCMSIKKHSNYNILPLLQGEIVNPLSVIAYSDNKLLQLKLAKEIGFLIPDSLISNDINHIKKWKRGRACIIKALGNPHLPYLESGVKQKAMTTVELQESYLEENPNKIEPFPIYIQEKINKKFEYRVVFVNGTFFSFRIDPYQHKIMNVDYRLGGGIVDYQPTFLPTIVEEKIKTFALTIDLFSGCFDLIEDINGNFIFLEVNPEGVWGHHDDLMEGKISEAFAISLINFNT